MDFPIFPKEIKNKTQGKKEWKNLKDKYAI